MSVCLFSLLQCGSFAFQSKLEQHFHEVERLHEIVQIVFVQKLARLGGWTENDHFSYLVLYFVLLVNLTAGIKNTAQSIILVSSVLQISF